MSDERSGEGPPPPSPLTGAYLLIVLPQLHSAQHKDRLIHALTKGLITWDAEDCHVDLDKELNNITSQAPEGEEAKNGERLIQFASENLVTEVLIHPQLNTLVQCMRNCLSSFTRHRHIVHAGYTSTGNGAWVLQDGTYSFSDFADMYSEHEVQRVLRAYEGTVSVDVHCSGEGDWWALKAKDPFSKVSRVRLNPPDKKSTTPAVRDFLKYLGQYLVPASLTDILESSDVVGNIRFSHPTLYVFPGGQGDAALFGINGFNMLVDGGFSRKSCFWDFTRHLDRLDSVLMTRINNGNLQGLASLLRRKKAEQVYPQIGHFFSNIPDRRQVLSPDGDKDRDPLLINLIEEGQEMLSGLRHLGLKPQACYRDPSVEPINLYHKVGHGKLDMYVLSPAKDSREVREFLAKWAAVDSKIFCSYSRKGEFNFPLCSKTSICALLVWQPANPEDNITRLLFPGSTPQQKIFEGLDKLKNLEFMKHPVCSAKSLSPSSSTMKLSIKAAPIKAPLIEKVAESEKKQAETVKAVKQVGEVKKSALPPKPKPKVDRPKEKTEKTKTDLETKQETVKKSSEAVQKLEKETKEVKKEKPKKIVQKQAEKKTQKPPEKKADSVKSSPTTPKKTVENKLSEMSRPENKIETKTRASRAKASPPATPAKSAKEENNRKVVELKSKETSRLQAQKAHPPKKEEPKKIERPVSKKPSTSPKGGKSLSPVKAAKPGAKQKLDVKKTVKSEKEITTDSSAVSTPSTIDAELTKAKEDAEKTKEVDESKQEELDRSRKESEDRGKSTSKEEDEEILIIEKVEISNEVTGKSDVETIAVHLQKAEEEKKKMKTVLKEEDLVVSEKEKDEKEELPLEAKQAAQEEVQEIIETATEIVTKKLDLQKTESQEISGKDLGSTDRLVTPKEKEVKSLDVEQRIDESQPDEKFSTTVESGATTTAPTLPEDERIPLDEIKEGVEEKYVKEETKEKEVIITPRPGQPTSLPQVPVIAGTIFDQRAQRLKDIVKTPDEVADLPVHEEADIGIYEGERTEELLPLSAAKRDRKDEATEELKLFKDNLEKEDKSKDLKEDMVESADVLSHTTTDIDLISSSPKSGKPLESEEKEEHAPEAEVKPDTVLDKEQEKADKSEIEVPDEKQREKEEKIDGEEKGEKPDIAEKPELEEKEAISVKEIKLDEKESKLDEKEAMIDEKEPKFGEKEEKLDEKQEKLDEKEAKIDEEKAKFDEKEAKIDKEEAKFDEKEGKLEEKESKIVEKVSELHEKEAKFDEKEAKLDEKEVKLDEKEAKFDDKEAKVDEKEAKIDEKESEFHEKEAMFDGKEAKLDEKEVKLDKKEVKLDEKEAKFDDKEAKVDEKEAKIEEREAKGDDKEAKLDDKEAKLDEKEIKHDKKEVKLDEKEAKFDDKEAKGDDKEAVLDDKEEKLDEKEVKLHKKEVKLDEKEAKFDDKEAKVAEKEAKIEEKEAKGDEKEANLDDKEAKLDEKEAKIDEKEVKLDDKEAKFDDKEAKVDEKEAKIEEKEAKGDDNEAKLDEKEVKHDKKEVKLDEKEAKFDDKEAKDDEKEAKIDEKEAKGDEKEAKLDDKEAKLDEKEAKLDEKEAKIDEKEAKFDDKEAKVDEKEAKIEEKEAKGDEKEAKLDDKEAKLDEKEVKHDKKEVKLDEKEAKFDDKEAKDDEKEEKIDEKEAKGDDKEAKLDDKEVKLDEKEVKSDKKEVKLEEKESKIDEKESEFHEKEAMFDGKEAKLDEKEVKLDKKEVKLDEKETKFDDKEAEVDEKEAQIDEKDVTIDEGEAKIGEKEAKGDDKEAKLDDREVKLDEKEVKIDKKEVKLEEKESKIDEKESEFQEKEAMFDEKEAKLDEKEVKLDKKEVKLDEKEAKFGDKEAEVDEKEAQIDEKYVKIDEGEAKIDEKEAKGDDKEAKLDDKEAKLDKKEVKLDEGEAKFEEEEAMFDKKEAKIDEKESKFHEKDVKIDEEEAKYDEKGAKVDEEEAKIYEKEGKIYEEESKFDEKVLNIDEKEAKIDEKEVMFDEKEAKFDEKEAKFDKKEAKLDEKEAKFDEKEARFLEKEAKRDEKEAKFDKKEAKLDEKEAKFDEKEAKLDKKEAKLDEKEEKLDKKEVKLDEKKVKLDEKEAMLAEREARLAEKEARLDEEGKEAKSVKEEKEANLDKEIKPHIEKAKIDEEEKQEIQKVDKEDIVIKEEKETLKELIAGISKTEILAGMEEIDKKQMEGKGKEKIQAKPIDTVIPKVLEKEKEDGKTQDEISEISTETKIAEDKDKMETTAVDKPKDAEVQKLEVSKVESKDTEVKGKTTPTFEEDILKQESIEVISTLIQPKKSLSPAEKYEDKSSEPEPQETGKASPAKEIIETDELKATEKVEIDSKIEGIKKVSPTEKEESTVKSGKEASESKIYTHETDTSFVDKLDLDESKLKEHTYINGLVSEDIEERDLVKDILGDHVKTSDVIKSMTKEEKEAVGEEQDVEQLISCAVIDARDQQKEEGEEEDVETSIEEKDQKEKTEKLKDIEPIKEVIGKTIDIKADVIPADFSGEVKELKAETIKTDLQETVEEITVVQKAIEEQTAKEVNEDEKTVAIVEKIETKTESSELVRESSKSALTEEPVELETKEISTIKSKVFPIEESLESKQSVEDVEQIKKESEVVVNGFLKDVADEKLELSKEAIPAPSTPPKEKEVTKVPVDLGVIQIPDSVKELKSTSQDVGVLESELDESKSPEQVAEQKLIKEDEEALFEKKQVEIKKDQKAESSAKLDSKTTVAEICGEPSSKTDIKMDKIEYKEQEAQEADIIKDEKTEEPTTEYKIAVDETPKDKKDGDKLETVTHLEDEKEQQEIRSETLVTHTTKEVEEKLKKGLETKEQEEEIVMKDEEKIAQDLGKKLPEEYEKLKIDISQEVQTSASMIKSDIILKPEEEIVEKTIMKGDEVSHTEPKVCEISDVKQKDGKEVVTSESKIDLEQKPLTDEKITEHVEKVSITSEEKTITSEEKVLTELTTEVVKKDKDLTEQLKGETETKEVELSKKEREDADKESDLVESDVSITKKEQKAETVKHLEDEEKKVDQKLAEGHILEEKSKTEVLENLETLSQMDESKLVVDDTVSEKYDSKEEIKFAELKSSSLQKVEDLGETTKREKESKKEDESQVKDLEGLQYEAKQDLKSKELEKELHDSKDLKEQVLTTDEFGDSKTQEVTESKILMEKRAEELSVQQSKDIESKALEKSEIPEIKSFVSKTSEQTEEVKPLGAKEKDILEEKKFDETKPAEETKDPNLKITLEDDSKSKIEKAPKSETSDKVITQVEKLDGALKDQEELKDSKLKTSEHVISETETALKAIGGEIVTEVNVLSTDLEVDFLSKDSKHADQDIMPEDFKTDIGKKESISESKIKADPDTTDETTKYSEPTEEKISFSGKDDGATVSKLTSDKKEGKSDVVEDEEAVKFKTSMMANQATQSKIADDKQLSVTETSVILAEAKTTSDKEDIDAHSATDIQKEVQSKLIEEQKDSQVKTSEDKKYSETKSTEEKVEVKSIILEETKDTESKTLEDKKELESKVSAEKEDPEFTEMKGKHLEPLVAVCKKEIEPEVPETEDSDTTFEEKMKETKPVASEKEKIPVDTQVKGDVSIKLEEKKIDKEAESQVGKVEIPSKVSGEKKDLEAKFLIGDKKDVDSKTSEMIKDEQAKHLEDEKSKLLDDGSKLVEEKTDLDHELLKSQVVLEPTATTVKKEIDFELSTDQKADAPSHPKPIDQIEQDEKIVCIKDESKIAAEKKDAELIKSEEKKGIEALKIETDTIRKEGEEIVKEEEKTVGLLSGKKDEKGGKSDLELAGGKETTIKNETSEIEKEIVSGTKPEGEISKDIDIKKTDIPQDKTDVQHVEEEVIATHISEVKSVISEKECLPSVSKSPEPSAQIQELTLSAVTSKSEMKTSTEEKKQTDSSEIEKISEVVSFETLTAETSFTIEPKKTTEIDISKAEKGSIDSSIKEQKTEKGHLTEGEDKAAFDLSLSTQIKQEVKSLDMHVEKKELTTEETSQKAEPKTSKVNGHTEKEIEDTVCSIQKLETRTSASEEISKIESSETSETTQLISSISAKGEKDTANADLKSKLKDEKQPQLTDVSTHEEKETTLESSKVSDIPYSEKRSSIVADEAKELSLKFTNGSRDEKHLEKIASEHMPEDSLTTSTILSEHSLLSNGKSGKDIHVSDEGCSILKTELKEEKGEGSSVVTTITTTVTTQEIVSEPKPSSSDKANGFQKKEDLQEKTDSSKPESKCTQESKESSGLGKVEVEQICKVEKIITEKHEIESVKDVSVIKSKLISDVSPALNGSVSEGETSSSKKEKLSNGTQITGHDKEDTVTESKIVETPLKTIKTEDTKTSSEGGKQTESKHQVKLDTKETCATKEISSKDTLESSSSPKTLESKHETVPQVSALRDISMIKDMTASFISTEKWTGRAVETPEGRLSPSSDASAVWRESDDDLPASPLSTTSHVHSPPPAMFSSVYGQRFEDDDSDVDFETAVREHTEVRGHPLTAKDSSLGQSFLVQSKESDPLLPKDPPQAFLDSGKPSTTSQDKTLAGTESHQSTSTSSQSFISSKDPIGKWDKPLGLPPPPSGKNYWSPFKEWGRPLHLPSPAPPPNENDNEDTSGSAKTTPKKVAKMNEENNRYASNIVIGKEANNKNRRSDSPVKKGMRDGKKTGMSHIYLDLSYVPHHGNSHYANVEFFKRVRARYYVFSGTEPSKEVFNALLEAKQTWEDKDLEVTIIPTYDTDTLGYWIAENEETLSKYKIDLSPSASRCTINLQDHDTSCSAYRLEF